MKKQHNRSSGNKSGFRALKDTDPRASRQVQHEAVESSSSSHGAVELIRAQAYRLFELRGQQPGHALDDWLLAEREILQSASPEDRIHM